MVARLLINQRLLSLDDGTIIEIVVWQLSEQAPGRSHLYRYRLHYGTLAGECIIRYDNEKRKGDHRHFGNKQERYAFVNVNQLLADFWRDVRRAKGATK